MANKLPYHCTYYDTRLSEPIEVTEREAVLENTLKLFRASDVVITDRFHGVIFAVLCQTPCVVLRTVDHKLTSAMHWFKDIPFVMLADRLEAVPSLVERCLTIENRKVRDWNLECFDRIPELICPRRNEKYTTWSTKRARFEY